MDQIPLQLDKEEIKRSEDSKRGGGGGRFFEEAIIFNSSIRGRQLFEGGD